MPDLVLLRHGQSLWNAEGRFTGWVDSDLSELGEQEARTAGRQLGERPDLAPWIVHTSLLTRAVRTANLALEELDRTWIPVRRHWRLNERHYGALQGKDKKETAAQFGAEQVHLWRRSFDVPPDPLADDDPSHPRFDPRYRDVPVGALPARECLADVVARLLPYWLDVIVPDLRRHGCVLVVAHGNSIRALVKHLLGISDQSIPGLEIPTGMPWWFSLNDQGEVEQDTFLGSPQAVAAAQAAVAAQAG